jgi:hypothetical protein
MGLSQNYDEALYELALAPEQAPAVLVSRRLFGRLTVGAAPGYVDAEFLYAELPGGLRVRSLRPGPLRDAREELAS